MRHPAPPSPVPAMPRSTPGARRMPLPRTVLARSAAAVLLGAGLTLAGCSDAPAPAARAKADADGNLRYGGIVFTPCALGNGRVKTVEAQCASFEVPEDHDAPAGRKISLALALIPAEGQPRPDPVVFIAGGPGQSILESYPSLHPAFDDLHRDRDILLVDARGTGGSHLLQCDEIRDVMRESGEEPSPERMLELGAQCRDRLSKTADLRRYATTDHIRDLDAVRAAMGIAQLNLAGVSYGTRVAQQYARRFPAHTRSVILDAVVPNTLVLGQDHARNLENALDAQFARCDAKSACLTALGDPRTHLQDLRTRLKAGNLAAVDYRDPVSGAWRSEAPSWGHLALLLRLYAYDPGASAMLPLVLKESADGRYQSLLSQARQISSGLGGSMAMGMSFSVSCTEDTELKLRPEDADTVLGTEFIEGMQAQCAQWPRGERPADFRAPLAGDVPVLALSGEYDPVTPPRYGEEVVKTLPNGRHLVVRGQGHGVLAAGCMPKLVAQFLDSLDAKALDAACLDRLAPLPPFSGLHGWEP